MDHAASDIDLYGSIQMGCKLMGLLGLPKASYAWRFRSSQALDGAHYPSTCVDVVLL